MLILLKPRIDAGAFLSGASALPTGPVCFIFCGEYVHLKRLKRMKEMKRLKQLKHLKRLNFEKNGTNGSNGTNATPGSPLVFGLRFLVLGLRHSIELSIVNWTIVNWLKGNIGVLASIPC